MLGISADVVDIDFSDNSNDATEAQQPPWNQSIILSLAGGGLMMERGLVRIKQSSWKMDGGGILVFRAKNGLNVLKRHAIRSFQGNNIFVAFLT